MKLDIDTLPIHAEWRPVLQRPEIAAPLYDAWQWARLRASTHTLLPGIERWLHCLSYCAPQDIKVVILGQDPYPNPEDAMGLSFSIPKDNPKIPGSLRNIRKELLRDMPEQHLPPHGDLSGWARQGVLLLNTVLTVDEGEAGSHIKKAGWERFTHALLHYLAENNPPIVALAWGKKAHTAASVLAPAHSVIQTSHPSGLGHFRSGKDFTAFTGSGFFSQANDMLIANDRPSINWFDL